MRPRSAWLVLANSPHRLVRIHRATRIVGQSFWYRRLLLHVDSRKFHMVRLVMGLIMVEHWASCWWVWLGREEFLLGGDRCVRARAREALTRQN